MLGLIRSVAAEMAPYNVRANVVNPGYFETETPSVLTQEQKDRWLSVMPQGHFGEADDVAHLVAFLASEKAKYITGQIISADGGMAI